MTDAVHIVVSFSDGSVSIETMFTRLPAARLSSDVAERNGFALVKGVWEREITDEMIEQLIAVRTEIWAHPERVKLTGEILPVVGWRRIGADDIPADRTNRDAWVDDGKALVLNPQRVPTPVRRLVPKSVIVSRLHSAGRLSAAVAAIESNVYIRERWYAPDKPAIYFDDAETLSLLHAIGADPDVIMAE